MNDLVFVMYNLKLKDRQVKKSIEIDNFEYVPSDDEWIASEGANCNEGMHEDEDYDGECDFVIVDEDGGEGDDGEGEGDDGEGEGHVEIMKACNWKKNNWKRMKMRMKMKKRRRRRRLSNILMIMNFTKLLSNHDFCCLKFVTLDV